jgi:hypothetical protein
LLYLYGYSRLTYEEIKQIYNTHPYGTTSLVGHGNVIVKITGYNQNIVYFLVYRPEGESKGEAPHQLLYGWTPYYGPIPPHFSSLPGGMGGQGWGQGQAFPPLGGQGSGGWGSWGGF